MNIHVIDLAFQTLEHAIAAFAIEGPNGLVLIECGPHSAFPVLEDALAQKGWKPSDVRHVFLTHIHFDHAGAAWAFARAGAQVHVHPRGFAHLAQPERLYNSARQIYGDRMDALWGAMLPIDEHRLHACGHGEIVHACGLELTSWHTPGHAVHHIAWEVRANGASTVLFTGDVAGVRIDQGPVAPPCPPPDIDVEAWLDSLEILRQRPAETLYLTHYGPVDDKHTHLDALEKRLLDWAAWMRPYAEQGAAAEAVIPAFQAYVQQQLREAGVAPEALARYEAANPAFMSVAGLMRYWNKKNNPTRPA